MSSVTKLWTEDDFRKELRRIDLHLKKTRGISRVGAELDIEYSDRAKCTLGVYYPKEKSSDYHCLFSTATCLKLVQVLTLIRRK